MSRLDRLESFETHLKDETEKQMSGKDIEEVIQLLKKENFDLKLRIYMEEKNSNDKNDFIKEQEIKINRLIAKTDELKDMIDELQTIIIDCKKKERMLIESNANYKLQLGIPIEQVHEMNIDSEFNAITITKHKKDTNDVATNNNDTSTEHSHHGWKSAGKWIKKIVRSKSKDGRSTSKQPEPVDKQETSVSNSLNRTERKSTRQFRQIRTSADDFSSSDDISNVTPTTNEIPRDPLFK